MTKTSEAGTTRVAAVLAINRLCAPGSELAIEQRWYPSTALDDLLEYELDPGVGDRRADTVGFVADDDKHILRRNETAGRSNHVRQQRLSANFMQHFGQLRFEARTFSGSHDRDSDAGRRLRQL